MGLSVEGDSKEQRQRTYYYNYIFGGNEQKITTTQGKGGCDKLPASHSTLFVFRFSEMVAEPDNTPTSGGFPPIDTNPREKHTRRRKRRVSPSSVVESIHLSSLRLKV
jgi:hypothetical protein